MRARSLLVGALALVSCSKHGGDAPAGPPRPSQGEQQKLPAFEQPADPLRNEKVALGQWLFFDQRLSGAGDRSCYSCHQNEDGTGGHDKVAVGSGGKVLTRHAPTLWNVRYWQHDLYDDGRAKSLEDVALAAWAGGNLGGASGADTPEAIAAALDQRVATLVAIPGYAAAFSHAFPDVKTPTSAHATAALAEYMRTIVCTDTAYDRFAAGDAKALDAAQQRGLDIFEGKGRCATCHTPPFFSAAMAVDGGVYFNVGIGTQGVAEAQVDSGRMTVSKQDSDWAAFKPPSLRDISKSAPYFHDGSAATLEAAVTIMSTGGIANRNKTPLLEDAQLTPAERADLIAFLHALDCSGQLEAPLAPPR